MKKPSDEHTGGYGIGDLLGLGSQSVRKNYYPALQQRIEELERGKINLRVQRLDDADEVHLVQSVQPFCL